MKRGSVRDTAASLTPRTDARFLLYHAYGKNSDSFSVGREALLDEVKFADGWATINGGRGASKSAETPFKNTVQKSIFDGLSDDFNTDKFLTPNWGQTLDSQQTARVKDGFLTLAPNDYQLAAAKSPEVIAAERTVSGNYTATARIDTAKISSGEAAGISVYSWRENALGISAGSGKIYVWRREDGVQKEVSSVALPANSAAINLRIKAVDGENFNFAHSLDGKTWLNLGGKVTFGNLEEARIALIYNGAIKNAGARFDWIKVEGN